MQAQVISILGSTGSIGRQTLDVAEHLGLQIAALTANENVERMAQQCRQFRPQLAVMGSAAAAAQLRQALGGQAIQILWGMEGLLEAATLPQCDTVVTAVMGMIGLQPTLAAIHAGKRIALANKETLVCAGELVMAEAARCGAQIIPVDSEHSAIFQCLMGNQHGQVRRLILTASGGPFFGWDGEQLKTVTKSQALRHPNWAMGEKITIDSATMMNKGLEFIEAMRLYALPPEQISIVVHRQSIIHSMVEYVDGTVMAQLGVPDMRLPIQLALTYPERLPSPVQALDLFRCASLTFAPPDVEHFPCLRLAMEAAARGGTACAVLNAANELAVALFLQEKIGFCEIPEYVAAALAQVPLEEASTLEGILAADQAARAAVAQRFSARHST